MRPLVLAAAALAAAAVMAPAAVASATGGASPESATNDSGGGTRYGSSLPRPAARPVASLALAERTLVAGKPLPSVSFRVSQAGMEQVQARVVVLRAAGKARVFRRSAGWVRTGRTVTVRWPSDDVAPRSGRYIVRLHVKDSRGRTLRRTSAHPGRTVLRVRPAPPAAQPQVPAAAPVPLMPAPVPSPAGKAIFPVVGEFGFGAADGRFGASRPGRTHEGQDITAGAGQPVVAPYAGTIASTSFQAKGAGEYIVLDAVDGRDYFFAHCTRNSTLVAEKQAVAAGTELCRVGSTGIAGGPHLHFEIWLVGWRVKGGAPIDPLPELRAWSGR